MKKKTATVEDLIREGTVYADDRIRDFNCTPVTIEQTSRMPTRGERHTEATRMLELETSYCVKCLQEDKQVTKDETIFAISTVLAWAKAVRAYAPHS
jgi:hypothetical protein